MAAGAPAGSALKLAIHLAEKGPGAGHDGRPLVSKGTPADLVAAHSTLTGQHLAAYVDT